LGLGWQLELELLEQQFAIVVRLSITREDQGALIGSWQVDVNHLDGSELLQHGAWGQAWRQTAQSGTQGDMQAVG